MNNQIKRGRPAKERDVVETFDPQSIKIVYNKQLNFSNTLFEPLKTESELDMILSIRHILPKLFPYPNIVNAR
jgi:hypothetical protein